MGSGGAECGKQRATAAVEVEAAVGSGEGSFLFMSGWGGRCFRGFGAGGAHGCGLGPWWQSLGYSGSSLNRLVGVLLGLRARGRKTEGFSHLLGSRGALPSFYGEEPPDCSVGISIHPCCQDGAPCLAVHSEARGAQGGRVAASTPVQRMLVCPWWKPLSLWSQDLQASSTSGHGDWKEPFC